MMTWSEFLIYANFSIALICMASAYVLLFCRIDGQFPYCSVCSTGKTLQDKKI